MTSRTRSLAVVAVVIVFLSAAPASATTSTGVLDTTFNGNGKLAISTAWTTGLMAPAPNNGLYVALDAQTNINSHGNYPVHLTRLLSNGTPDPTFGSKGHADVLLSSGTNTIAGLLHDGSGLLLLMFDQTNRDFGIVRLTATGHLDTTLGGTGRIVFTPPSDRFAGLAAAHLLPDGRIELIIGSDRGVEPHDGGFSLMRLHPDGSPDSTFAPYGVKTLETWSNVGDGPNSSPQIAFTSNGKIYGTLPYGSIGRITLRRFASNGLADTSFNGGDARPYACPAWQKTADGPELRVDSLGRPTLFCTFGSPADVFVSRLTTAGAADGSFGSHGTIRAWIHADYDTDIRYALDGANGVVFEYMNGKADSGTVVYVRRYTSAGLIDSPFATSGTATLTFGPIYDLGTGPVFGTHRIYVSLTPNEAPSEVDLAVTA